MARTKSSQSVDSKILTRIKRRGAGVVVVPADFLNLARRQAICVALHRLTKEGTIRRLARGSYDLPKTHPVMGELSPSIEDVARSLADRDRIRLQPTGAYALKMLGLSEQVPAKVVFLTKSPRRTVRISSIVIQLRHTTPSNMVRGFSFRRITRKVLNPRLLLALLHKHLRRGITVSLRLANPAFTDDHMLAET